MRFTTKEMIQQANEQRVAMANETNTEFKQSIANVSHNLKIAGRMSVIVFEAALQRYYGVDRRSCDNLSALINGFKRHPRIQAGMRKLLAFHAPVELTKSKGVWKVTNREGVSKKQIAKCKAECGKLVAMELTSILNHPSIKVKVEVEWSIEKDATTFKKAVKSMLEHGVDVAEIAKMLDVAVKQQVADTQKAADDVASKVTAIKATKAA